MFDFLKSLFIPKPYNEGYMPTSDGHDLYYAEYGNPRGIPVLTFHAGPGGSSKAQHTTIFPLRRCRVIVFDQRGCGKSKPFGSLDHNTVPKTIEDAVKLLDFLNIKEKVVVRGGSFGSTLSLLFAEKYPNRVRKLVVYSIYLARKQDYHDWMETMQNIYPEFYAELMKPVPKGKTSFDYYHQKIMSASPAEQEKIARHFVGYEYMLGQLDPAFLPEANERFIVKAKIGLHYQVHNYFMKDNQILKDSAKIKAIPTLIVHNRMDLICAVKQAYDLHQALPKSKLVIVPERGHGGVLQTKMMTEEIAKFL